jgi:hypothetical protein
VLLEVRAHSWGSVCGGVPWLAVAGIQAHVPCFWLLHVPFFEMRAKNPVGG